MTPLPDFLDISNVANPFTLAYLAVLVGGLCRLLKTKTASQIIAWLPPDDLKMIPPTAIPWIAVAVAGLAALGNAKLNAHTDWPHALALGLMAAVLSGGTAIGGHETLGKLAGLIFAKPTPPSNDAPPAQPPTGGGSLSRRMFVAAAATLILVAAFASPPTLSTPMAGAELAAGCTAAEAKTAKDVALTIADFACIAASDLTDVPALIKACNLIESPALKAFLDTAVGEREAAKRSGFRWPGPAKSLDAGRDGS